MTIDSCHDHSSLSINGVGDNDDVNTGGGLPVGDQGGQRHRNALTNSAAHSGDVVQLATSAKKRDARRSQARARRWRSRGGKYFQQVQSRMRCFRRGCDRTKKKIRPTKERLIREAATNKVGE